MLPYMKITEHHWTNNFTPTPHDLHQHGFAGPVWDASVSSTGRNYPLRDTIKGAWESAGVEALPEYDGNDGHPRGLAELVENRHGGLRQLASTVYPLNGVTVMTDTLVKKVLFSSKGGTVSATGIELANGTHYLTRREVIVSAGAYRTPQLLMLSGVGSKYDLEAHGIDQVVDSPALGQNLWDHLQMVQSWKLRDPSSGVAIGSNNPLFSEPQFGLGLPVDWIVTSTVPVDGLKKAIEADEGNPPGPDHPLLARTRSFLETLVLYTAAPYDGSHIGSSLISFMPTSRGTVRLNTTNPADAPTIDPQYYTTEVDRYVMRTGMRALANTLQSTPEGKALIDSETVPTGFKPALNATDAELDAYVRVTTG
jgi:choline dehydrogenase-like flavoprotein